MATSPLRVLLLDATPEVADLLAHALSGSGLAAQLNSHQSPLPGDIVVSLGDAYDLAITCLAGADSGIATVADLAQIAPALPIIAVASAGHGDLAHAAVQAGAQDAWLAPDSLSSDLSARVRFALLRQRRVTGLQAEALVDDLTGLYNRRGFMRVGALQLGLCVRNRLPASVLVSDIDGLKEINDSGGHRAGDLVLVRIAQVLRESVRASDVVGRLGGDEFGIMATGTSAEGARALIARVDARLGLVTAAECGLRGVGLSIGGASRAVASPDALEELVQEADSDMYSHKRARRAPSGADAVGAMRTAIAGSAVLAEDEAASPQLADEAPADGAVVRCIAPTGVG